MTVSKLVMGTLPEVIKSFLSIRRSFEMDRGRPVSSPETRRPSFGQKAYGFPPEVSYPETRWIDSIAS